MTTDLLTPDAEARASYLIAEYADAKLRMRDLRARQAAGERIYYLIEAEGLTQCEIRRDLRDLGVDFFATFR